MRISDWSSDVCSSDLAFRGIFDRDGPAGSWGQLAEYRGLQPSRTGSRHARRNGKPCTCEGASRRYVGRLDGRAIFWRERQKPSFFADARGGRPSRPRNKSDKRDVGKGGTSKRRTRWTP